MTVVNTAVIGDAASPRQNVGSSMQQDAGPADVGEAWFRRARTEMVA